MRVLLPRSHDAAVATVISGCWVKPRVQHPRPAARRVWAWPGPGGGRMRPVGQRDRQGPCGSAAGMLRPLGKGGQPQRCGTPAQSWARGSHWFHLTLLPPGSPRGCHIPPLFPSPTHPALGSSPPSPSHRSSWGSLVPGTSIPGIPVPAVPVPAVPVPVILLPAVSILGVPVPGVPVPGVPILVSPSPVCEQGPMRGAVGQGSAG